MKKRKTTALLILFLIGMVLSACSGKPAESTVHDEPDYANGKIDTRQFLSFVDGEADTVDPQCTSSYYIIALNVFDRLVEIQANADGSSRIVPSLADSWTISPDGLTYTFRLHKGISFSNGSALTSRDVLYTLTRLLTHPDACNQDIAIGILGADQLRSGEQNTLAGFSVISDDVFSITLAEPYAAFLACLSTPGASILDEETTRAAGERFGHDPAATVGTGPFIFREWNPGSAMILEANPDCWSGAPRCKGLHIHLLNDTEAQRIMFEKGTLDILDLEAMSTDAEYFIHGDIYQAHLRQGLRVGISYIALNQSVEPLNNVRVRKALQMGLNRQALLDAIYSGRGAVENGIFPHGLIGYNPALPPIPYDPQGARALLEEAGWQDGFDLPLTVSSSSSQALKDLLSMAAIMWQKIGVRAHVAEIDDSAFMAQRKSGKLACYTSTWSADFNDPDNFIFTFFGTRQNSLGRSLCYTDDEVIKRVQNARAIVDDGQRILEYQALEKKIVQEDAAWIPLFSKQHYFVVSDRVDGFQVSWNGWSSNNYRNVAIKEE